MIFLRDRDTGASWDTSDSELEELRTPINDKFDKRSVSFLGVYDERID